MQKRIEAFVRLGQWFGNFCKMWPLVDSAEFRELKLAVVNQHGFDGWMTEPFLLKALKLWSKRLSIESLETFVNRFPELKKLHEAQKFAVLPAAHIPMAGFQDIVCAVLAGQEVYCRNINQTENLTEIITHRLIEFEPELSGYIHWGDSLPKNIDNYLVNLKDENESAQLQYFGKKHSLVRQKRISVAVIARADTKDDFRKLGSDIFTFFGLSCRNVRKLYVPSDFKFDPFFEAMEEYAFVYQSNRYANNYDYNRSVFLMDSKPFLDNGFLMIHESSELHVPIGCLFVEYYYSSEDLLHKLKLAEPHIQQIVTNFAGIKNRVSPGQAHAWPLWDFDDHKNVVKFLTE
ncbi:MAG: hypothetical protein Q8928_18815 [Bacteroidota bacterium]|nr:hypothetical protein [Bacteroidota bacterium]